MGDLGDGSTVGPEKRGVLGRLRDLIFGQVPVQRRPGSHPAPTAETQDFGAPTGRFTQKGEGQTRLDAPDKRRRDIGDNKVQGDVFQPVAAMLDAVYGLNAASPDLSDLSAASPEVLVGLSASAEAFGAWLSQTAEGEGAEFKPLDLTKFGPEEQVLAFDQSLAALISGAAALTLGGGTAFKDPVNTVMRFAFSGEGWAVNARSRLPKPRLLPGFEGLLPDQKLDIPPLLERLARDGELREQFNALARCGMVQKNQPAFAQSPRIIGSVIGLSPTRCCAGDTLTVSFTGFGSQPPAPDWRLFLIVPVRHGFLPIPAADLTPNLMAPGAWQNAGTVSVKLPQDVAPGPVGFALHPPVNENLGECGPGSLAMAANNIQSLLIDARGVQGAAMGVGLGRLANGAEGFFAAPPRPQGQAGDPNWLEAGMPEITAFRRVGQGFLYPAASMTLEWDTYNATAVRIEVQTASNSEGPHTLTIPAGNQPAKGSLQVPLTINSRWIARIALVATNPNGCGEVRSEIEVDSGFAEYVIGLGKADVTDYRPGLPMQGFAADFQQSSGLLLQAPATQTRRAVPPIPLYARAFFIMPNRPTGPRKPFILVVADIWSGSEGVKRAVLAQLATRLPHMAIDHDNLMICGTHTHSGPGAFLDHFLYNMTAGGFDQGVFDCIVSGMVNAVAQAANSAGPGFVSAAKGPLFGCGKNRSMPAYQRNPGKQNVTDPAQAIDHEMLLLRFDKLRRSSNGPDARAPVGMVNWFAVHPTNIGMFNNLISGDNKGWAAFITEEERGPGFIAAFANAAAGDVSANMDGGIPLGGPQNPQAMAFDIDRMVDAGNRQAACARQLFDGPSTELRGDIGFSHSFVNMANYRFAQAPNDRTWPAALGVSFGAGSSEDSYAAIAANFLGLGRLDAGIIEGIDRSQFQWGLAVAGTVGVGLTLAGWLAGNIRGTYSEPVSRSAVMAVVGKAAFAITLAAKNLHPRADAQYRYEWEVPVTSALDVDAGHGHKPIMFPMGEVKVAKINRTTGQVDRLECPMVPNIIPLQLVKIGDVALAACPAELNAEAGIQLKQRLRTAFGVSVLHTAIAGYANGYSGYVATEAEYNAQHYEGACTLYGPKTLEAYCDRFSQMARRIIDQSAPVVPTEPPYIPPVLQRRP